MSNREGQQLGHYYLLRLLKQNEMFEVYLGEHIYLHTQAAIKVLRIQLSDSDLELFLSKARVIANLVHSNIVRLLDFGVQGTTPFLVVSYAPHGTLRNLHPIGTPLAVASIISYVEQIAMGLQYAHERQLMHLNVSPENMLLGTNNAVLLSDFSTTFINSLSSQKEIEMVNSMRYAAPEQILGRPTPSTDQYALGAVVYEWLCGTPLFRGSYQEIAYQHLHSSPQPLYKKIPAILPEVEEVVLRALAKAPQQRFANVQIFAHALEKAHQLEVLTVRRYPFKPQPQSLLPPTQPIPPSKLNSSSYTQISPKSRVSRRTLVIGLLGAVGLTGAGGITWMLHSAGQHKTDIPPTSLAVSSPILGTPIYTYRNHLLGLNAVAWSPDGMRIASGSLDQTVQIWDAPTGGDILYYRGHSSSVFAVTWSPDGKYIASGGDRRVLVWESATGHTIFNYGGHPHGVYAVAWLPHGTRIASAGTNDNDHATVQVWDATTGGHIATYDNNATLIYSVAWSPDGKRIAATSSNGFTTNGDNTVVVWDVDTGNLAFAYRGHSSTVRGIAWSPDGMRIASVSSEVHVWNATTGKHVLIYRGHALGVLTVGWSPDGRHIATGSADRTVQVWNASTGHLVYTYHGHDAVVTTLAWSPNGQLIASGSADKTVQVWQAM